MQTTDREMISVARWVCLARCRGLLAIGAGDYWTAVGRRDTLCHYYYYNIQTGHIKHFE
jgi:hypothetical protein